MEPVVTQNMVVEATTDAVRQEFTSLADTLADIADRETRVATYTARLATCSPAARHVAALFARKEQQHIDHVRGTLAQIEAYPSADKNPHDFTKDALYFFVTSGKFACKVVGESIERLFKLETERHYREEAHHPEFEGVHGTECDSSDILEMAIDRMSRNIQASGRVVMEGMMRYLPVFSLGDNKAKQEQFVQYVKRYTDITERVYAEMFK